jgi:hypothetical protein
MEMLQRITVLLLIIVGFMSALVNSQCMLNDCLCKDNLILCDGSNDREPTFTYEERQFARTLKLSLKQLPLIRGVCRTFPLLRYVEISDNTGIHTGHDNDGSVATCPRLTCRSVKVTCL